MKVVVIAVVVMLVGISLYISTAEKSGAAPDAVSDRGAIELEPSSVSECANPVKAPVVPGNPRKAALQQALARRKVVATPKRSTVVRADDPCMRHIQDTLSTIDSPRRRISIHSRLPSIDKELRSMAIDCNLSDDHRRELQNLIRPIDAKLVDAKVARAKRKYTDAARLLLSGRFTTYSADDKSAYSSEMKRLGIKPVRWDTGALRELVTFPGADSTERRFVLFDQESAPDTVRAFRAELLLRQERRRVISEFARSKQ